MSPSGSVVVLSTTTVIVISITSLLVAVLFPTCGFLVGMMVQRAINRKMRLDSNAVLADDSSVTHTSELTPVYEDILPPEKQKKIELQENIAYGPVALAT